MDKSTFEYLKPTEAQVQQMGIVREAAKIYADKLEEMLPEGEDKMYVLRLHRTAAMWANIAITRLANGQPRT